MSLVHNEQTKLTATYLNGLAIALFAVGTLAPVISIFASAAPPPDRAVAAVSLICLCVSLAIHLFARAILRSLRA